jgi:hypothetical protein
MADKPEVAAPLLGEGPRALDAFLDKWQRESDCYASGAMMASPVGDMNRAAATAIRDMLKELRPLARPPQSPAPEGELEIYDVREARRFLETKPESPYAWEAVGHIKDLLGHIKTLQIMLPPLHAKIADLKERLQVAEDALARLTAAVLPYVEWWGAAHEADCPEDDTCRCNGKPINDALNAALKPTARLTAEKSVVLFVWKCEKCGCLWRDNLDGFVSLYPNYHSCQECEMRPTKHACKPFALNLVMLPERPSQTGEPT